ncbi:MAG TPA: oxidative damage protection protein [Nitrospiria bacterium]
MEKRMVQCVKFKDERPGLSRPPIPGDLGQRIYENVSEDAWKLFKEHFKMIINEYRLDLMSPKADDILNQQAEEFFFGKSGETGSPES